MRVIERHHVVRASFVLALPLLAAAHGCGADVLIFGSDVGGGSPGGGEAGPPCVPVDDNNPCTEDVCDNGVPVHHPRSDGTGCGNGEVCQSGTCSAGCFIDGMVDALCGVGAWPFSEGSGGTTADTTGNADGTLSNTAWIAGHSGNGLQFFGSGSPSSVLIPYNAPLKFGTGDFTVVAWVARLGAWSINEAIVVGANRCGVQEAWLLSMLGASSSSSNPGFATFGTGSTGGYLVSPTPIADTNWHQLAGRRSGTTVTLLVDGVVKATGTVSSSYSSDAGGAGMMVGNLQDGIQDPTCPAGREFNGKIDSIYLFNQALTDADIASLQ